MVRATFRFHGDLDAFLAPARRGCAFSCACARNASAKHMIEALGVPHTEVGRILVNGVAADLARRLGDGDRVEVWPAAAAGPAAPPAEAPRFIADAHLGGLARLLRLAGFDARHDNRLGDAEIAAVALHESRWVLSRDVELLKRRDISCGCYVRALTPREQFREIVARLRLASLVRPFTRCLVCNVALRPAPREEVLECLPPRVRDEHQRFSRCDACGRVYWEGSHWRRLRELLEATHERP